MPQVAPAQVAVALVAAAQRRAQAPQLSGSAMSDASQPSVTLALQLPKPAVHVTEQKLPAHDEVELARAGHALPHAPQFITEVRVSVSQPLAAFMSQLP